MQNKRLLKTPIMSPCAFHLAGVAYFMPLRLCVIGAWKPSTDNTLDHSAREACISPYITGWFYGSEHLHKAKQLSPGGRSFASAFPHLKLPSFKNFHLGVIAQAPRWKIIHCVYNKLQKLKQTPSKASRSQGFCFGNLPKFSSRHLGMGGLGLQHVFIDVSWKDCYPEWLAWLPVSDSGCLG